MVWVELRRAAVPVLAFLLSLAPALTASEVFPLRVTVRGAAGAPLDAYVSAVAPDRPEWRPSAEATGSGLLTLRLGAGTYRLFVAARGYQDVVRDVVVKGPKEETFELARSIPVSGVVQDVAGRPIPGAQIRHARLTGAVQTSRVSEQARVLLEGDWSTVTDAEGRWTLPGRSDGAIPVVIEAHGYEPVHQFRARTATETAPAATTLYTGASLRVTLDRGDADQLLTLVSDSPPREADRWQKPVWSRSAATGTAAWDSLPAGTYQIVAHSTNPRRFARSSPLGSVTLSAGESADIRLDLPRLPRPDPDALVLFLPERPPDDISELRAVVSSAHGPEEVQHALERASRGTLIYVKTNASPGELYLTTTELILTPAERDKPAADAPVRLLTTGRADLEVLFATSEGAPALPAFATAHFGSCGPMRDLVVATAVTAEKRLSVPFPTACTALVLKLPPFAPVGMRMSMSPREKRSRGPYILDLAASANVRVVRDPSGAAAAGAVVRAATGGAGEEIVYATAVADEQGKVVLDGLPVDQDVIVEARDSNDNSGALIVRTAAGETSVVDPLNIAEPASLTIVPRLSADVRERIPKARVHSATIARTLDAAMDQRHNAPVDAEGRASFSRIRPGRWRPVLLVEGAGTIQPIPADDIELRPGEVRRVDVDVDALVFSGRVIDGGRNAVQAQVGFGDPPGRGAVTRLVSTDVAGRFDVLLPSRGTYRISVRPQREPDVRIDLGESDLSDPQRPVILQLPSGVLTVRVREADRPIRGARITATLRRPTAYGGVSATSRSAATNEGGESLVEALLPGRWLVQAVDPASGSRAEAAVDVGATDRAVVDLALVKPSTLAGVIRRASGTPAAGAAVECLFIGPSGMPQFVRADTSVDARFTIDLPTPPPARLQCGVATSAGEIEAYTLATTSNAELQLSAESGSLVVEGWLTAADREVLWLVRRDGRAFRLSSLTGRAAITGQSLVVPRTPAGAWKLVRAAAPEQLVRIATGGAYSLDALAEFTLQRGDVKVIHVR